MNKKGTIPIGIIAGGIILLIVGLILFSQGVVGTSVVESRFTTRTPGCDAPLLPVALKGELVVEDTAIFGVEPVVKDLNVLSVRPGLKILGVSEQEFEYKVNAVDPFTGETLDSTKGKSVQTGDNSINYEEFNLFFRIPDNNCDGKVDDFSVRLESELRFDPVFGGLETKTFSKDVNWVGGRLQ